MARPPRPILSLTARLTLSLVFGTTLLWIAAASYATYASYHELDEAFDGALQEAAQRLLPLAEREALGHDQADARPMRRFHGGRREYLSFQVRNAAGDILLRAHDAPSAPYDQVATPGFSTVGNYRLFTDTDETTGLTITVAETTKGRWEAVLGGARGMLWPLIGLIPLNVLAIWLAVRGAMKPVKRLSGDIASRGGHNLAPLDISDQPGELRPIAEAVAKLVERLRAALDAERAFAANSAHELRTPIAGALAQTQRLIAELSESKDRRRAREVETTLKRLSTLSEKLMQVSRADAGIGLADQQVDLMPVLDLVVGECAKRLDEPGRIRYAKPEGVTLVAAMDMDAFAMAARNLIDNALAHGAAEGPVDVKVDANGVVRVINDGPAVPAETLARLKQRFARGDTRHAGSGLGLAIVETVMTQAGGRCELFSPAPGREDGFEARLTMKASPGLSAPTGAAI
jgi:two-component system OmpR family sensor kinase